MVIVEGDVCQTLYLELFLDHPMPPCISNPRGTTQAQLAAISLEENKGQCNSQDANLGPVDYLLCIGLTIFPLRFFSSLAPSEQCEPSGTSKPYEPELPRLKRRSVCLHSLH